MASLGMIDGLLITLQHSATIGGVAVSHVSIQAQSFELTHFLARPCFGWSITFTPSSGHICRRARCFERRWCVAAQKIENVRRQVGIDSMGWRHSCTGSVSAWNSDQILGLSRTVTRIWRGNTLKRWRYRPNSHLYQMVMIQYLKLRSKSKNISRN